jgi:transcriptional regulator with XRE-family HTH domain
MDQDSSFYRKVGELVRAERKSKNFSQQYLADKTSLSRVSITNIELGKQKLLLHTLVDIAKALEVPPDKLIPVDEPKVDFESVKDQLPTREAKRLMKGFFDDGETAEE